MVAEARGEWTESEGSDASTEWESHRLLPSVTSPAAGAGGGGGLAGCGCGSVASSLRSVRGPGSVTIGGDQFGWSLCTKVV
jgi:hypothetical protein